MIAHVIRWPASNPMPVLLCAAGVKNSLAHLSITAVQPRAEAQP